MKERLSAAPPLVVKIPPSDLRIKVCNTDDVEEYLAVGSRTASTIRNLMRRLGLGLGGFQSILDFACGCGRTLNFLRRHIAPDLLNGSDYDEELIDWCRRNLDIGRLEVNRSLPPVNAFADHTFDFIYSISFFTHLDEDDQWKWLSEFKRLLKEDGVLLLSLHGPSLAREHAIGMPSRGFLFQRRKRGTFNQQVSYQTREFAERHWTSEFKIVHYEERGLLHHQDLALLAPKQPALGVPQWPDIPEVLWEVYRDRPDLQEEFDRHGLGRPGTTWKNLSLLDWGYSYGSREDSRLEYLRDLFQIQPTGER